jgi:hypothetical protein
MTEMLLFRLNRVTPENVLSFLRLLNGKPLTPGTDLEELAQWRDMRPEEQAKLIAAIIREQRENERAVTPIDVEGLALATDSHVGRARCLRDPLSQFHSQNFQHVVVLVKDKLDKNEYFMEADSNVAAEAFKKVREDLESRCLLTTRVDVAPAELCKLAVHVTGKLALDAVKEKVIDGATRALRRFLDPLCGGHDGKGWPFGRAVYVSELYALLDPLPGIESLDEVVILDTGRATGGDDNGFNQPSSIANETPSRRMVITLGDDQLVYLDPAKITIDVNY